MVDFLERQGMRFAHADGWSDYYDERPGGQPRGRSLVAEVFDVNELGEWKSRLAMYPGIALPLGSEDFPTLFLAKKTTAGKKMAMRLVWRMLKNKLLGRDVRGGGAAIQGRMLQIALREKLPIRTEMAVRDFVVENGRVVGVVAVSEGREVRIQARDGVLINAGGFSRNREMRERWQPKPNAWQWTNANPGDTGEMIEAAMRLGAAVDCMNEAWWVITSLGPGETLPEGAVNPEGIPIPFMHHLDLSLPHLIMVDQDGRRFCDESGAYMEIGQRLYARHEQTGRGIPAWVILDSRHRDNYPWGTAQPGKTPQSWLDSGYMKKADTLAELARLCGIDAAGLAAEVAKFNGYCRTGVDPEFNAWRPRIRSRARRPHRQAEPEPRRDRAGAVLRGRDVPGRRRHGGRHRHRRARARAARRRLGDRRPVRDRQFHRLGRGSVLSRRRRQHRRVVRVRISRRTARGQGGGASRDP